MLKKESSRGSRLKALLFIPLAVASLYAFTRPKIVRTEELFKKTDPVEMKELQTSTFTASIEIKGYASMLSDLNRLYKIMPEKERILHYTTPDVPLIKRMDEHIHSIKNKILEEVYDYITAFSPEVTREDITNSAIIQCDTITEGKYLQCKLMLQVSVVEIAIFTPLINESGFVRKMNLWLAESSEELPITIKLRTLPREKK
jgi:hypothetical protein